MRQASIAEMIRRGLRDQYDAVLTLGWSDQPPRSTGGASSAKQSRPGPKAHRRSWSSVRVSHECFEAL